MACHSFGMLRLVTQSVQYYPLDQIVTHGHVIMSLG